MPMIATPARNGTRPPQVMNCSSVVTPGVIAKTSAESRQPMPTPVRLNPLSMPRRFDGGPGNPLAGAGRDR